MNTSIFETETLGLNWPAGENPPRGHDGQYPCPDGGPPALTHGPGYIPPTLTTFSPTPQATTPHPTATRLSASFDEYGWLIGAAVLLILLKR